MNIILDGKQVEAQAGETILEVARRNGVDIPTLCYSTAFGGKGHCRMCMVEVKTGSARRLVASCTYPIFSEIEVKTSNPAIERIRRNIIMLLTKRAQGSEFMNNLFKEYSCQDNAIEGDPSERCILCRLCSYACQEMGTSAISAVMRGTDKKVSTPYDEASVTCIGCGSCAEVCPTGAIQMVDDGKHRTIWNKTFELVKCEKCGKPFTTVEELNYVKEKTEYDVTAKLCEMCRRKELANKFSEFTE